LQKEIVTTPIDRAFISSGAFFLSESYFASIEKYTGRDIAVLSAKFCNRNRHRDSQLLYHFFKDKGTPMSY